MGWYLLRESRKQAWLEQKRGRKDGGDGPTEVSTQGEDEDPTGDAKDFGFDSERPGEQGFEQTSHIT